MTFQEIQQERKLNPEKRFRHMLFWMRTSHLLTQKKSFICKSLGRLCGMYYSFLSGWLLGVDISYNTQIGKGLIIYHGFGLVIHPDAIIGENVILRHTTTIGNATMNGPAPTIGNNVNIGCHSIIIGDITIGDNCVIGAGTTITKNVPANCTVVGSPAMIVNKCGIKCKEKL